MPDAETFFASIASQRSFNSPPQRDGIPFGVLVELDDIIEKSGSTALHHALREVVLRLGETHLLADPRIARLIEVWDGIVGTAEERIKHHLVDILGVVPDPTLIRYVFRCLSGSASRRGRHSGAHLYSFDEVLRRVASTHPQEAALRCQCCGFHFRAKDIAQDRIRTVQDAGLRFERSLFPGRADDPYKPIQSSRNSYSLTQLSVDHVVPEETLGWSESDNLEILCMFCNLGKVAFRRPLEAVSSFAVGALAEVPRDRGFGTLKHQIVVAALRYQGGTCSRCGKSKIEIELTVRPTKRSHEQVLKGFAPWNLQTLCYPCVDALEVEREDEDVSVAGAEDERELGVSFAELVE